LGCGQISAKRFRSNLGAQDSACHIRKVDLTFPPKSRPSPKETCEMTLTEEEEAVLKWSRAKRLEEFQKVNVGLDPKTLERKLFYIDTITVDNGEILDILKLTPNLPWEKVRDMFLGEPVDGYTSTYHGLQDIVYPQHFWKATIENEREKI
jgi:hypothetical protein